MLVIAAAVMLAGQAMGRFVNKADGQKQRIELQETFESCCVKL